MDYDGRMVTPDRRKGLIRIVTDGNGMKTFEWCDSANKTPIESFYVFPDESKFEKVKQSNERVYLLEMKATEQRYFYWMQVIYNELIFQEADEEKDEERAKTVHNTLNNIT